MAFDQTYLNTVMKKGPPNVVMGPTDDHYTTVVSQFVQIEESARLPFMEAFEELYTMIVTIVEKWSSYIAFLGKYGQVQIFEIVRA